jgi:GTP-binding protein HflX
LSDTVGFIRNLPHTLVESFKSTLDEVLEADLLLIVVDISHDNYKSQLETTRNVLKEIGAGHLPVVHVFNKIDRVEDPFLGRILRQAYPGSLAVSAYSPPDVARLREHIYQFFVSNFVRCKLAIPSADQDAVSLVYRNCMILSVDYERQDLAVFDVHVTKEFYPKLAAYRLQEEQELFKS